MDWFDLLALQGTLKSLLEHHSSKAAVFQHSAFFMAQLSHPHMTTGKTIAETRLIFVGKVMSLLFHMLSRLVIVYLPRSKCPFISWLQSPSAVILEPKKIMYVNCTSIKKIFFNCGGGVTQSLFPGCLATINKTMSMKPHLPLSILVNGIYMAFNHFGSSQTTNCDTGSLLPLPDSSFCSVILGFRILPLHEYIKKTSVIELIFKVKVLVTQSCPNLCNAVDCSPPGSSVHGIF